MKSKEPDITIYSKDDPQQYVDEREFWDNQSYEYKLEALEIIRAQSFKIGSQDAEHFPRLRRVLTIIKRQ